MSITNSLNNEVNSVDRATFAFKFISTNNLMSQLLSHNSGSLKMLFTEDIYLIPERKTPVPENHTILQAVAEQQDNSKPQSEAALSIEYVGDNNKYFLVLHSDQVHTRMNPVHLEMLLKVMVAKNLELRDLAIVNLSRYPGIKFDSLKRYFSCTRVALFGVHPPEIGLEALKLNAEQTEGNVKILATCSLEEMRNNANKKREFWNVMKAF